MNCRRWIFAAACAVALALATPAQAAADPRSDNSVSGKSIDETFSGSGRLVLDDGDRFGPWRTVFDGNADRASVVVRGGELRLKPRAATDPAETYSALVVSRARFTADPLHVSARWVTSRTTRIGTPNPWEVGWLVWDYRDNDHFTYLVLKPNGWEVGRRDPSQPGGQRHLYDGPLPKTPIGMKRSVTVDRVGPQTTIRVNGEFLVAYDLPYSERRGAVGMYAEDSVVRWMDISADQRPSDSVVRLR